MSEKILNAILHLFAVIAIVQGKDGGAKTLPVVRDYLRRQLGIRKIDEYLDLFNAMVDFFDDAEDTDMAALESRLLEIADTLARELPRVKQYATLLCFLEVCRSSPDSEAILQGLLDKIVARFRIPEDIFRDFLLLVRISSGEPVPLSGDRFLCHLTSGYEVENSSRVLNRQGFNAAFVSFFPENESYCFVAALGKTLYLDANPLCPGAPRLFQPGGILQDGFSGVIYFPELASAHTGKSEAELEFCGTALDFRFPGSDNGLHDFSFRLGGGEMVGVMGSSGSGKSTLLGILNGSQKPDNGSLTINGIDIYKNRMVLDGVIGFVPQDDLLFEDLTVFENLDFAARLALSHLAREERESRITNLLIELGQIETAHLKVGSPIDKTISGGQRKRLNIALELIRRPKVLFVDEPTSGLSSNDSENVMGLLKAQAAKGCILLVVIHQPSSAIFRMFDRLWILDKGGYPIFDGNPIEAIRHFRDAAYIAGSADCVCPECGNVNPEQIFNIIEARADDERGAFFGERLTSPEEWHTVYKKERPQLPAPAENLSRPSGAECLSRPDKLRQTLIFLHRDIKTRISNLQYVLVNLLVPPLLGTLVAVLCRGSQKGEYLFYDNPNIATFFFITVVAAIFMGLNSSGEEIIRDTRVLLRERFLRLSWPCYVNGKILFQALLLAGQALLFILPACAILQIPDFTLPLWVVFFSLAISSATLGLNVSSAFKSVSTIYILIPLILIPQILLSGLIIPYEELIPANAGHRNVPVAANIMPSRWGYEALLVHQFANNRKMEPLVADEVHILQAEYILDYLIPELQSLKDSAFLFDPDTGMERMNPEDLRTLAIGLESLAAQAGLRVGVSSDDLTSVRYNREIAAKITDFLQSATTFFWEARKKASVQKGVLEKALVERYGAEGWQRMKKEKTNKSVEDLALATYSLEKITRSGERLVQKASPISQPPGSSWGGAHFLSRIKRIGNIEVQTFYFNTGVLWISFVTLLLALYFRLLAMLLKK